VIEPLEERHNRDYDRKPFDRLADVYGGRDELPPPPPPLLLE